MRELPHGAGRWFTTRAHSLAFLFPVSGPGSLGPPHGEQVPDVGSAVLEGPEAPPAQPNGGGRSPELPRSPAHAEVEAFRGQKPNALGGAEVPAEEACHLGAPLRAVQGLGGYDQGEGAVFAKVFGQRVPIARNAAGLCGTIRRVEQYVRPRDVAEDTCVEIGEHNWAAPSEKAQHPGQTMAAPELENTGRRGVLQRTPRCGAYTPPFLPP
mmetsp:Transcript_7590/g.25710  ORF Transcript_7590/g.25710 Transcript_7590/m.25710 type:complete len:211 (+) Transcript_7590:57-689(+)